MPYLSMAAALDAEPRFMMTEASISIWGSAFTSTTAWYGSETVTASRPFKERMNLRTSVRFANEGRRIEWANTGPHPIPLSPEIRESVLCGCQGEEADGAGWRRRTPREGENISRKSCRSPVIPRPALYLH